MCVAALAWQAHPRWRLVAIGNRDEYHERPSAPLAPWDDPAGMLAGRDLRAGGTWLGVAGSDESQGNGQDGGHGGRFALVTNFRVPGYPRPDRASRGALVTGWLAQGEVPPMEAMNPFNLFLADPGRAEFVTNHPAATRRTLSPGIHGLSNGPFAEPWPKTRELCGALGHWLDAGEPGFEPLLAALRRETPEPPADWQPGHPEPHYAPVFIRNAVYGTRCSTVVAIGADGAGSVIERSYDPGGNATGDASFAFRWRVW